MKRFSLTGQKAFSVLLCFTLFTGSVAISNPRIWGPPNGEPTNMVSFSSFNRVAFGGLCLVVVRSKAGQTGIITVKAKSSGFNDIQVKIKSK